MKLKLQRPLVVFDLETTGVQVSTDRILEISLLKVHPDGTRELHTERFNPGCPIPPEVSEVHGIRDQDVAGMPAFSERAAWLNTWISNCDLAGYNSNRFDVPLLVEEFLRAGIVFDENRRYVDVQRIFTQMEKRTLEAAVRFYCHRALENAHSAEADTLATWDVLEAQLDRYAEELEPDVAFLERFTTEEEYVDFGRRMIYQNGVEVFHFGKHKGRAVEEVFEREPSYYDWMLKGDFPAHTKLKLKQIWERFRARRAR
jgi:DNA polymerase-3 subunit epsilon